MRLPYNLLEVIALMLCLTLQITAHAVVRGPSTLSHHQPGVDTLTPGNALPGNETRSGTSDESVVYYDEAGRDSNGLYSTGRPLNGNRERVAAPEFFTPTLSRKPPKPIETAYLDALQILQRDNTCSRFFGSAIEALVKFAEQLQLRELESAAIGIRMSGSFTTVTNRTTGASYRLFDSVAVNSHGPFFIRRNPSTHHQLLVGSFRGESREARVLMLLHELGHLIRQPDGGWRLPNDGGNPLVSDRNTVMVERKCGEQIKALKTKNGNAPLDVKDSIDYQFPADVARIDGDVRSN